MFPSINIEKLKVGDKVEFKTFFSFFYPKLLSLACRFVDKHVAVDLVQDVFILYWEEKDTIEKVNVQAYLYKVLQNKCLNVLKHDAVIGNYKSRLQIAEARLIYINNHLHQNDTWKQLMTKDIEDVVEASLQKLPPRCAEAFRLIFFHDLPHKKVAEIMNISHRTVESHVRQAVGFLRIELRDLILLILLLVK